VIVAVKDARDDSAATKINGPGAEARHSLDFRIPTHRHDATIFDGHGLSDSPLGIKCIDLAVE
jgi:hypothetical protein